MFKLNPLPAYSQHARSRGSSMGEGQKPDFQKPDFPSTPLHQTPGKYVPAVIKEGECHFTPFTIDTPPNTRSCDER